MMIVANVYGRLRVGGPVDDIRWLFNDSPILTGNVEIRRNQLIIANAQINDQGLYTCQGIVGHREINTYIRLFVVCEYKILIHLFTAGRLWPSYYNIIINYIVLLKLNLIQYEV